MPTLNSLEDFEHDANENTEQTRSAASNSESILFKTIPPHRKRQ